MIVASASIVDTLQPKPRLLAYAAKLFLAAFLMLGPAVPFASAGCLGKGLIQPPLAGNLPALAAPAAHPDLPAPESGWPYSIVGLWNLQFFYQGQVVDVAFDAWHSDGTEVLNDFTDPIEGNVCLGVWEQTGPSTYKLKHPSWYFDTNGILQGTVVIHETVTVSRDGNSFSGKYTDDVYDTSGNLLEEYSGKLSATRIKAE